MIELAIELKNRKRYESIVRVHIYILIKKLNILNKI